MGLGNRLWVQDLLRGNRNVPEFLVVMAAQSLNIPKKIAHLKWQDCAICTEQNVQSIVELAGWCFTSEPFPISWES